MVRQLVRERDALKVEVAELWKHSRRECAEALVGEADAAGEREAMKAASEADALEPRAGDAGALG